MPSSLVLLFLLPFAFPSPPFTPSYPSPQGLVECSLTHCPHSVSPLTPSDLLPSQAILYSTSLDGDRLKKTPLKIRKSFQWSNSRGQASTVTIRLDELSTGQSIIGFGGAMTDAASINIASLPKRLQFELLQSYFGNDGIGYNIIRIPIASCDFSTHEYSYVETPSDFSLRSFALHQEDQLKINYTRQSIVIANFDKSDVKVFGSPWSAPAWMKTNGHMRGGGRLKEGINYTRSYAQYLVRFIEEYTRRGVPIWGLTLQNEPSTGLDKEYSFQTMYMSPQMEADFALNYLKPALRASKTARKTLLMIHDDFRGNLPDWPDITLKDPKVSEIIHGIAVHWYGDRGTDPNKLTVTHQRHPKQFILSTEACVTDTHGVTLGNFTRAIFYAKDIIEDLQHSVSGWVDWNIALDLQGGPNWVSNFVDSPIIVDASKKVFYRQPMFYALGHFSRFMREGAVVMGSKVETNGLRVSAIGVVNTDTSNVIVILNEEDHEVEISIRHTSSVIKTTLKAQSINTVIFKTKESVYP